MAFVPVYCNPWAGCIPAGKGKDILRDKKALDSIVRRMRVMNLTTGESDKGWMGEFNKTLRSRMMDRRKSHGF